MKVKHPCVPRRDKLRHAHTRQWNDPYFWVMSADEEAVEALVAKEQAFANHALAPIVPLKKSLVKQLFSRVADEHSDVPMRFDDYDYWSSYSRGEEHKREYRRKSGLYASEELFLDVNTILNSDGADIGDWTLSPDHLYLAYTLDETGEERYRLFLVHIASGHTWYRPEQNVGPEVSWGADATSLFYTSLDDQGRVTTLLHHNLLTVWAQDKVICDEPNAEFELSIERSRDERNLVVTSAGDDSTEVWLIRFSSTDLSAQLVRSRQTGVEYYIETRNDQLLMLTNEPDGQNFSLAVCEPDASSSKQWETVLYPQSGVSYEWIACYRDYVLLHEIVDGHDSYRAILPRNSGWQTQLFKATSPIQDITFVDDESFFSTVLRFEHSSLSSPELVEEINVRSGERTVMKESLPADGFDADDYIEERIYVKHHHVSVPVSIVYKKTLRREGGNPLVLYGYGAYQTKDETWFDPDLLSLLDQGVIYAIAHVRGGGGNGRAWYDDGRILKKKNSVDDYVAVLDSLIAQNWTSAGNIIVYGNSAGGLLVGGALNERSNVLCGAVTEVPFVDVVETMFNLDWPTTVQDFDEFGDPRDPEVFEAMWHYCPMRNIQPAHYPPVYVTASLYDQRVPWWEALRWVTNLRHNNLSSNQIILQIHTNSGHQGVMGRYKETHATAEVYAFMLNCFGIENLHPEDNQATGK